MEKFYNEHDLYDRAKKRAKAIRSFYINLLCYCIVIPILIAVNLIFTPEFLWFFFSAGGWGIGLAFHGMEAFDYYPFLGRNWEQRKLKELIKKEEQTKSSWKI